MSEYMECGEISITPDTGQIKAPEPCATAREEMPDDRTSRGKSLPRADEIDGMMNEIRRLTDEPERLLESHLGIFTEPAPPGKLINSQG